MFDKIMGLWIMDIKSINPLDKIMDFPTWSSPDYHEIWCVKTIYKQIFFRENEKKF